MSRTSPLAPALAALATLAPLAALSACTVTSMGPESGPPRIESDGLLEGHAAVGWRDEDRFLRFDLLDGESDGAVGELVLWKLLRIEVGALGLGIGIGPLDLALGTLFYEPEVPPMRGEARPAAAAPAGADHDAADCPICAGTER